jgi:hypothetical protein
VSIPCQARILASRTQSMTVMILALSLTLAGGLVVSRSWLRRSSRREVGSIEDASIVHFLGERRQPLPALSHLTVFRYLFPMQRSL